MLPLLQLIACGLDEGGLLSGDASLDQTSGDGAPLNDVVSEKVFDNYVPPIACSDPDASLDASCLGPAALPAGWEPFAMIIDAGNAACPGDGGDFTAVQYVTDPRIAGNNCVCMGCGGASSTWSCAGVLGAGPTCTEQTQLVSSMPYCWQTDHIAYSGAISRTGSASCAPTTYFSSNTSTTSVAGCAPTRCQSDFCGLASQGYKVCARSSTSDGGCPGGFTFASTYSVGVSAHAQCNACPTCALTNPDAGCSAKLSTFKNDSCDAGGFMTSEFADGGCDFDNGTNTFGSVLYQPAAVPVAMCGPSLPSNVGGTGVLDGVVTVCCVN